jgi:hypothetical protein
MKKMLKVFNFKVGLVVFAAIIIGSVVTVGVFAAIPNSSTGIITACRANNDGSLRAIDAQNGAACSGNETALKWSKGLPALKDGNGQVLGDFIDDSSIPNTPTVVDVYNHTINRLISLSTNGSDAVIVPNVSFAYFTTTNCTGQAYFADSDSYDARFKTALFRYRSASNDVFVKVNTNTVGVQITASSYLEQDGSCTPAGSTSTFHPVNQVTLPFSLPLAVPYTF